MGGVKYVCWADTTGYAIAGQAYLLALLRAGVNLTWAPLLCPGARYELAAAPPSADPALAAIAHRPIDYDTVVIHTVPEYYPEWIAREQAPGRRIFGYTVWELEHLPAHWPQILNRLDGVMVPCRWNVDVFRRSGVTVPIHVVPHLPQFDDGASAGDAARAAVLRRLGGAEAIDGRLVFYTIGFWTNRKAPEDVLEAYCRAFRQDDPVFLAIKTCEKDLTRWRRSWKSGFRLRHPPPHASARDLVRRFPEAPPWCVITDEAMPDAEMLALHELGDVYVSLARAEGWGLGAYDAARRGNPVVMTGYGGQTDFLDPGLAWLVDYEMVPVHEPVWSASYTAADRWAQPSMEQAVAFMREIAADPEGARARAARLAGSIAERFSEQKIVAGLMSVLQGA